MKTLVASAVSLAVMCGFCAAADFALVDGDGVASVVIPQTPDESTKLAAAELTNYVFKITGREMPVVTRGNAAKLALDALEHGGEGDVSFSVDCDGFVAHVFLLWI